MNTIGLELSEEEVKLLCVRAVSGTGGKQTKCIFSGDVQDQITGNKVLILADPGVNKKDQLLQKFR